MKYMPIENNRPLQAIENMVANGGNIEKAVKEAGYSEAYARSGKFQQTLQFHELTEAYLPDDMLLRALADDIGTKVGNRKPELELAFKVKGKMIDKSELSVKELPIIQVSEEIIKKHDTARSTEANS